MKKFDCVHVLKKLNNEHPGGDYNILAISKMFTAEKMLIDKYHFSKEEVMALSPNYYNRIDQKVGQ